MEFLSERPEVLPTLNITRDESVAFKTGGRCGKRKLVKATFPIPSTSGLTRQPGVLI